MIGKHHTTRTRGFTLVELLVAMAISAFLTLTVFFVMTSSSRAFRVQQDIGQVSDRLNYALDSIKNDLRRTSFLTVPNAYLPQTQYPWYRQVCAPPHWMTAENGGMAVAHSVMVREASGDGLPYYRPRAEDRILLGRDPDQLVMIGAFRATESFRPLVMRPGNPEIVIANNGFDVGQMQYIFTDAWLAVSTPAGGVQFLSVTSIDPGATQTTLTVAQALLPDPTGTGLEACNFTGFGGGTFEVVPLHFVRYSLLTDPDDRESTVLVREELNRNGQPLTNLSRHIVSRDIVDFQVWFDGVDPAGVRTRVVQDDEGSGTFVDDQGSVGSGNLDGETDSEPENARFAYVQLSARLDTTVTRNPPALVGGATLREFIELLDCPSSGDCVPSGEFTRVVTVRSEVDLPNMNLANTRTNP